MNYKGKLITIEGISGIGKSYYFNLLQKENLNNIIFNKEINDDNNIGFNKKIFEILLSNNSRFFDNDNPKMETLLITAKQANDENMFIIPNLNNGLNVISDRGFDTICIIEGIMLSLKYNNDIEENIMNLYNILPNFCRIPNKTILLTGNFEKAIKRATKRDKLEYTKKELFILKKSWEFYNLIAKKNTDRFDIIDVDNYSDKEIIEKIKIIIK